jgi:plastocyanin
MRKLAAGMTVAALGLAGSAPAATQEVHKRTVRADPDGGLSFTRKRVTVDHGFVKLVLRNPSTSGLPHGVAVGRHKSKFVNPGHSTSVLVKLRKGTYTFYCPVPGHRAAGMKGKLVVE